MRPPATYLNRHRAPPTETPQLDLSALARPRAATLAAEVLNACRVSGGEGPFDSVFAIPAVCFRAAAGPVEVPTNTVQAVAVTMMD